MNWAFELLGLSSDADAAAVKQAYARLLRTTRPDEDPEGFQRLHAAYKMVLAHANTQSMSRIHPAVTAAEPASELPSETRSTKPPSSPQALTPLSVGTADASAVNLDSLANEVIRAAMEATDGESLSCSLHARQEFWSIQIKQLAGHRVLNRLFQQPQAISADCMDALLQFFDLDHVLSGVDALALRALRTRQRTLWEVLPGHQHELAKRIGLEWKTPPEVALLEKDIALLQKPRTWSRVLGVALQFGRIREIGRLVHTLLGQGGFQELPPSIDREHAFFWYRAAASGLTMTQQRFAIGLLRSFLAAMACIAGLLLFLVIGTMSMPPTEAEWISAISISASVGALVFVLWPLFACGAWFDQWQGQPESVRSRRPWLRRLAIPGSCAFGLMCYEAGAATFGGWVVALSFIFAVRKFRRRMASTGKTSFSIGPIAPAFVFIALAVARALPQVRDIGELPFIPVMATITFCLVIVDLWRYRSYLHPKLARN